MSEQAVIQCIINSYRNSGLAQPGSGLRAKITRATNAARAGNHPKKLYTAADILAKPGRCIDGHVEGITYTAGSDDHTKLPLYVASYVLGKKEISPALAEARRYKGQSADAYGLRTAERRVSTQPRERSRVQQSQSAARERLMATMRAGPTAGRRTPSPVRRAPSQSRRTRSPRPTAQGAASRPPRGGQTTDELFARLVRQGVAQEGGRRRR